MDHTASLDTGRLARALRVRAIAALAIILAIAATSIAARAATIEPQSYEGDFLPAATSAVEDWGYWVRGSFDARPALARYDDSHRIVAMSRTNGGIHEGAIVTLPDRGVALGGDCAVARFDATGELTWSSSAVATRLDCPTSLALDGAGNFWVHGECRVDFCSVKGGRVVQYDSHGVVERELETSRFGFPRASALAAVPREGGAYVAASDGARIVRLHAGGSVAWTWVDRLASATRFDRLAVTPDETLWAFGITGADTLLAVGLSPDGELRFRQEVGTIGNATLVDADVGASGAAVLIGDAIEQNFVDAPGSYLEYHGLATHGFDVDGTPLFRRDGTVSALCIGCAVRLGDTGDTVVTVNAGPLGADGRVRRYTRNGDARAEIMLGDTALYAEPARGGEVLAARFVQGGVGDRLRRYSASGVSLAPPQARASGVFPDHAASAFTAAGDVVTLAAAEVGAPNVLMWHEPAGELRWRHEVAPADFRSAHVVAGPRRACWTGFGPSFLSPKNLVLECFDAANGAAVFSVEVVRLTGGPIVLALSEDDSVVVGYGIIDASPPFGVVERYGADGAKLRSTVVPGRPVASNRRGDVLFDTGASLILLDRNGTQRYTYDEARDALGSRRAFHLTESGRAVFSADDRDDRQVYLTELSTGGALAWRVPRGDGSEVAITSIGDDVFVARVRESDLGIERYVTRHAEADGRRVWEQRDDRAASRDSLLAADAGSSTLAFASSWRVARTVVTIFNAATGTVRRDSIEPCPLRACGLDGLAVDAGGTVRYVEAETGLASIAYVPNHAPSFRIRAIERERAPNTDRSNRFAGAWYPAHAGGQGLIIDQHDASGAVFGAWFTYARNGRNDPADLRWYTLHGAIAPNATTVTLDLLENRGGVFATAPATTAMRVGSATLTLDACERATLTYTFDPAVNAGEHGRTTLTRLAGSDCAARSTSMDPPRTDQIGGFSAAQSGSWVSPDSAGQGFLMSIDPGRQLFAGWFTYDPEGAADDPTAQHWFTLQASLAQASGGTVELPILRTIGGSFNELATRNSYVVGTATLVFSDCENATLRYRFDAGAGAFARREGLLSLRKIGGCGRS